MKDSKIRKIVLTGGPCAGKSRIIGDLGNQLNEKGYYVYENKNNGFKLESPDLQMCISYAKMGNNVVANDTEMSNNVGETATEIIQETDQYKIYKEENGEYVYEIKSSGVKLTSPDLERCLKYVDQSKSQLDEMFLEEDVTKNNADSMMKR